MHPLIPLGTLTPLDVLCADLKARIEARGLGPPRSFMRWAEQILVDHPEGKALVLPGPTALPGDLEIDYDSLAEHGVTTVAVLGDLTVNGRMINADSDGGPFLFVDGNLKAAQIEKGGANFIILGALTCRGVLFCDYNHGALLTGGDIEAEAIIACDQDVYAGGEIKGPVISDDLGNMREMLVPEVFEDPEDPEDEFADGALIRERLAAGLPVLKG